MDIMECFPEENALGQRFLVDLCRGRFEKSWETDELEHSVSYGELYEICKMVVEGEPCKLIETLAEQIAAQVLNRLNKVIACNGKSYETGSADPGSFSISCCRN